MRGNDRKLKPNVVSSEFLTRIKYLEMPVLFTTCPCGAPFSVGLNLSISCSTERNWRGILPLETMLLLKWNCFEGKNMARKMKGRQKIKCCFDFPNKYIFKNSLIPKIKAKWTCRTTELFSDNLTGTLLFGTWLLGPFLPAPCH